MIKFLSEILGWFCKYDFIGEKPAKVKKPRKTREKSASESPKKTGGGAKKGKKRNPWSDEDSDVSLASDESLDDKEISFTDSVEQREKGPRRAAGWFFVQYSFYFGSENFLFLHSLRVSCGKVFEKEMK